MKTFIFAILVGISSAAVLNTVDKGPSDVLAEIPFTPPQDQRCAGRNYGGRRCCTPEDPCDEGEGDCDGPLDGGANDGNRGCKGNLVCGSNNCEKFGHYYHPKDDCCEKPGSLVTPVQEPEFPNAPSQPPSGQRCSGRNFQGRRCCTPENPCNEGEGDCDGPLDGGQNDGHAGCKGDLVCGSNNCKQFGNYYHPKDDCCERPSGFQPQIDETPEADVFGQDGWGEWEAWSQCTARCGGGNKTRNKFCFGSSCSHTTETQTQPCNTKPCF